MSYHILHILTPNCYLSVDKGFLYCTQKEDGTQNFISIDDLRAIIIAAHGTSFSNNCICKLLENNIIILHCNNTYKPVGWSVPNDRVIRTKVFQNQIAQNEDFENKLWKKILKAKVKNQYNALILMGKNCTEIERLITRPLISEANIAKKYWAEYFEILDIKIKREHKNAENFENICLNYGYAVIVSLIYRSVIIHGLISGLGIHHKEKYKSTPLIYDLMEPYRPFIDYYFYKFKKENKKDDFKEWTKFLANCIKNYRIKTGKEKISFKLIDTVDIYIENICNAFLNFECNDIFIPDIKEQYLFISKHKNREYEE